MKLTKSVLVEPVVTEKAVAMKGKVGFVVENDATKASITAAIKEFYGLTPVSVNISRLPEKFKMGRFGKVRKRFSFKKAVVTLPEGESIDFNAFK